MASTVLQTGGMHCASCSMLIEMTVGDLPGVTAVKSDYVNGATTVEYDPTQVTVEDIVNAIVEAGYTAEPVS